MPIKSIQISQTGVIGPIPQWVYIETDDTYATVTTAGYLNGAAHEFVNSFRTNMMALVSTKTSQSVGVAPVLYLLQITNTNGVWTLVPPAVDVPVPFIVLGNIQAGANGTAGAFLSYPATLNSGFLELAAVANTGNTATIISNAAMGQASTISIPDPGNATASFLLTRSSVANQIINSGGLQVANGNLYIGQNATTPAQSLVLFPATINRGNLSITAISNVGNTVTAIANASMGQASTIIIPDPGTANTKFVLADSASAQTISGGLIVSTGNITAQTGNIQAGSSGHAGLFSTFPATMSKGSLQLKAVENTGDTITIISNAAMGQASTVSIPDPGAATANFVLDHGSTTMAAGSSITLAKVNGTEAANAVTASGVAGVITTSSLTTAGGSSYAITWTNTKITATSVIGLTIQGGTNTTQNITFSCVPGSGTATLTIYNNTAATALNGTILIGYMVF